MNETSVISTTAEKQTETASVQFSAPFDPSEDQEKAQNFITSFVKEAMDKKDRSKVLTTLGGYAGTGKSRLLGFMAKGWEQDGLRVGFVTLTGKAANVLTASLKASGVSARANTIHSTIYQPDIDEETGAVLQYRRRDELGFDIIVIDEASMVSEEVYNDLASFGIPIIAVGDHGQLPPVGEPPFLMKDPVCQLTHIHRQAAGNPIIELSSIIRTGCDLSTVLKFINETDDNRVQHRKGWKSIPVLLAETEENGMILTHSNRARTSINRQARKQYLWKTDDTPIVGEKLICLRNHRDKYGFIANGQRCDVMSVVPVGEDHLDLSVSLEGSEPIPLRVCKHQFNIPTTFKTFGEVPGGPYFAWKHVGALFDFGYALTVHKSQGSSEHNVGILMTRSLSMMNREERVRWLYTGVTRASGRVTIVTHL